MGLHREADHLDLLIHKTAVPLEGMISLPTTTEVLHYDDEDEDEEDVIDVTWESEEPVVDPVYTSGYSPVAWYGALQSLGTSVIMIPFEEDALQDSDILALSSVFEVEAYDYEDLKMKTNSFSMQSEEKFGDRDKLKLAFPSLWAAISNVLNEKGLKEEGVVYLLFNEDHPPPRGLFHPEKSPHYFAHDIGHIDVDFGENYGLAGDVYSFLYDISRFYKSEDGSILSEDLADEYDSKHYSEESVQQIIDYVFENIFSGESSDNVFDVISHALAGEISIDTPETIDFDNKEYELQEGSESDVAKAIDSFTEGYMKQIGGDDAPLSEFKGSVMLYDI